MSQQLLTDSDISVSGTWSKTWSPSESPFGPFSTYYEHLNRVTDNYGLQITTSSASGVSDTVVCGLSNPPSTPDSTGTITVTVRAYRQGSNSGAAGCFMVYLMEGSTVRGSYDLGANLTLATLQTKTFNVAANTISDWTNLSIKFEHIRNTNRDHRPKWVQVDVPDAVTTNITVNAVVSDTTVDQSDSTVTTDINQTAVVSNTAINGKQPTIATDGTVVIGADTTGVSIVAADSTVSATRFIELDTIVSNTTISAAGASIQTEENVITFVPIDDTSITAADADTLTGFDLGALLFNQEKIFAFKLGNNGTRSYDITLSVTSVNSSVVDLVEFSSDKQTYSSTITIESVHPNTVTDPVWVRFSPASAEPGEGTFLINVEQSNA